MPAVEHNLWGIFSSVAAEVPEREAVVWRDQRLTYADLADRSARLGDVLARHGLGLHREREGLDPWEVGQDTVGLYLLNSPAYLEATLGGYAARTAPFNVNYRYVADELAYLLRDADLSALVYHARFAPTVADVLDRLPRRPLLLQVADETAHPLLPGALDYDRALADASPEPPPPGHSPDDLYVLYTGGTTGMPKGTLWRQTDIWMAALGGDAHAPDADDATIAATAAAGVARRVLPNAPFMHGAAHWLGVRAVLAGDTVIVNGVVDRLDPVDVWQTVEREKVEATLFVGEAFARPLLTELEKGGYDASSLAIVVVGGAVTSPETKQRVLADLPQVMIADMAGSSETGSALGQVSAAGNVPGAGMFTFGDDVAILDMALEHRLLPGDGSVGWFAKTGHIPLGYLGDRTKTERTFPTVDGRRWSVPGDLAKPCGPGTMQLLGRDSASINTAGEKVFAEEVEQALLLHPAVEDILVVGRPSERWGQEIVAVVQMVPGVEARDVDLLDAASAHIARFKLPKAIVRVPEVRRSPAGKADYGWARGVAEPDQT